MLPRLRLVARLLAFLLAMVFSAVLASLIKLVELIRRQPVDRSPWARLCFNLARRSLGIRVTQTGVPAEAPVMFVSNHVSWADIPVLGGIAPLRFLSKAEVGRWPGIGWLAKQAGTLFIQRGTGQSDQRRRCLSGALQGGESVLVFPEATTSSGESVLPFHGKLLTAASEAGTAIQPISLCYLRDGQPCEIAPFIGDDDFREHLTRMLSLPAVEVAVIFHAPVHFPASTDPGTMARQLHGVVQRGLDRLRPGACDQENARPAVSSSSVA
ncbi:MAG: 1-acyl-sn-glycerol-3-phosphate acyltransferase [Marinobacter sp.]|nr:1-acyl-sn-glycerol-3-phosphate acyltransferase [Marinobacter sp.]